MGAPTPRLLALAQPLTPLHEAAYRFAAYLAELERRLRRSAQESPSDRAKRELTEKLTLLFAWFARVEATWSREQITHAKRDVREILGAWLWRSELWSRAHFKPHGYAGDFGLSDRMDATKNDDALKPPIVACLDHAFAQLDVARALNERRAVLSSVLLRERSRKREPLSILDVTPRGGRHLGDYLADLRDAGADERLTITDDDTAALAFTERTVLANWPGMPVRWIAAPLHRVRSAILGELYDVILVSTQLDALDDESAREDLGVLASCLAKNGVLVALNLHTADGSRGVREWLLDWPCYARDEERVLELFPSGAEASRSPDGLLTIATYRNARS